MNRKGIMKSNSKSNNKSHNRKPIVEQLNEDLDQVAAECNGVQGICIVPDGEVLCVEFAVPSGHSKDLDNAVSQATAMLEERYGIAGLEALSDDEYEDVDNEEQCDYWLYTIRWE